MKPIWVFVSYFDGIEKVRIVKRGVGQRGLARPVKNPVLVEDEDGDQFVVDADLLYNDPMSADLASAKMRVELGENPLDEETDDEEDEETDEDEEETDDQEEEQEELAD